MRRHVVDTAARRGCDHAVDAAGNVVVRKPAAAGHDAAPVTILQSHLDMVQEKNADVAHDFATDAIVPRRDGDYLKATGTTLGSDNGIGVAAMLAVMEATDLVHGPLELLFTIDEETGLTGAAQLDAGLLAGRQLINLDSEEEGLVYVGCAGGGDTRITLPLAAAAAAGDDVAVTLALTGLKGGHSGCDIHLQRGNAVALLARGALGGAPAGAAAPGPARGRQRPQRHPPRGVRDGRARRVRARARRGRHPRGVRRDSGRVPACRPRHGAGGRRRGPRGHGLDPRDDDDRAATRGEPAARRRRR